MLRVLRNRYIAIGRQAEIVMRPTAFGFVRERLRRDKSDHEAGVSAMLLVCQIFDPKVGKGPLDDERIREAGWAVRNEEAFCRALTSAVYLTSYGRFIASTFGRKVGVFHFSDPFIKFSAALEFAQAPTQFIQKVGWENMMPLMNLRALGLFRLLPLRNTVEMMQEIVEFQKSVESTPITTRDEDEEIPF